MRGREKEKVKERKCRRRKERRDKKKEAFTYTLTELRRLSIERRPLEAIN